MINENFLARIPRTTSPREVSLEHLAPPAGSGALFRTRRLGGSAGRSVPGCLTTVLAIFFAAWLPCDAPAWGQSQASRAAIETNEPEPPVIAAASDEGRTALAGFKIPAGLRAELFAAEPLVANVVAFQVAPDGRIFLCETFRQQKGVEDNRSHMNWLDDDLAAQTVDDRLKYLQKHLGDRILEYTRQDDRIRVLIDRDGDRVADTSQVFARRFNGILDGTGAGVLVNGSDVFYTCIPHLWKLGDPDGDGVAEQRQSLYRGFGVRFAFRGHDMHGLIMGPDGRIYFSIGDRGYNIQTPQGRLVNPESGAVFRCEPDGSNLEVFAMGLRNPQELAFDNFGNLFTGDNNSDSGDQARWVYVVQDGDTGWRMSFQYLGDRGPFNRERIWHPYHPEQPAYIVPPIANFADGPSGLSFYPGTGFGASFEDRFFLCDFRGGAAQSGIRSFRLEAEGAFFKMVDPQQPFWNILATDLDFGPDGALYVSDWVNGWNGEGKGRIYRFSDPEADANDVVRNVQRLLRAGLGQQTREQLTDLLAHPDRRVRQQAQFELVEREETAALREVALSSDPDLLARVHAIWGWDQLARRGQVESLEAALPLLGDPTDEIRAQAARLMGDQGYEPAFAALLNLLHDPYPRAQYFAAKAIGQLGRPQALNEVTEFIERNQDQDPILRHGGILALWGMGVTPVATLSQHPSPAVRRAAVVALRKRASRWFSRASQYSTESTRLALNALARFLDDPEPAVALEAARAIHDVPPLGLEQPAYLSLATQATRPILPDPMARRVLNMNLRLGDAASAERVAQFASRDDVSTAMRLEALAILESWQEPSPRDRVLGMWRPTPKTHRAPAGLALKRHLGQLLAAPAGVGAATARVAARLGLQEVIPNVRAMLDNQGLPGPQRAEALEGLIQLAVKDLDDLLAASALDAAAEVRIAARTALATRRPELAVPMLVAATQADQFQERQQAILGLGIANTDPAREAVAELVQQAIQDQLPLDSHLEVIEVAQKMKAPEIRRLLNQYRSQVQSKRHGRFRVAVRGGDPQRGKLLFVERSDASCRRCHLVNGDGGNVGPELSEIGANKDRDYLLEAIVEPNKAIAKGFESLVVQDVDGKIHVGIVKQEDDQILRLMDADGKTITLRQEDLEGRRPGKSAMPEDMAKQLSLRDIRDLVAYLETLKVKQSPEGHQ